MMKAKSSPKKIPKTRTNKKKSGMSVITKDRNPFLDEKNKSPISDDGTNVTSSSACAISYTPIPEDYQSPSKENDIPLSFDSPSGSMPSLSREMDDHYDSCSDKILDNLECSDEDAFDFERQVANKPVKPVRPVKLSLASTKEISGCEKSPEVTKAPFSSGPHPMAPPSATGHVLQDNEPRSDSPLPQESEWEHTNRDWTYLIPDDNDQSVRVIWHDHDIIAMRYIKAPCSLEIGPALDKPMVPDQPSTTCKVQLTSIAELENESAYRIWSVSIQTPHTGLKTDFFGIAKHYSYSYFDRAPYIGFIEDTGDVDRPIFHYWFFTDKPEKVMKAIYDNMQILSSPGRNPLPPIAAIQRLNYKGFRDQSVQILMRQKAKQGYFYVNGGLDCFMVTSLLNFYEGWARYIITTPFYKDDIYEGDYDSANLRAFMHGQGFSDKHDTFKKFFYTGRFGEDLTSLTYREKYIRDSLGAGKAQ